MMRTDKRYAIILLDKRWLAILLIAVMGMSIDQLTTSYAVTENNASIEGNLFLRYVFTTLPKPLDLLYYGFAQTIIVTLGILLLWVSCPKKISYNQATILSSVIAMLPMAVGINNVILLLS